MACKATEAPIAGKLRPALTFLSALQAILAASCIFFSSIASGLDPWYGSIEGWGLLIDPDSDCSFLVSDDSIQIRVPETPHGLSAELNRMNAPRVLQQVSGDFDLEVEVEGTFQPQQPTVPTRTPYLGAGLVLMRDDANYIRLERAALRRRGSVSHYINFEQRRNGRLLRFGTPADYALTADDRIRLKVSVRGKAVTAFVQKNRSGWHELGTKRFVTSGRLAAGVTAINATNVPQQAQFRSLRLIPSTTSTAEMGPKFADGLRAVFVYATDPIEAQKYKQLLSAHKIDVHIVAAEHLNSNQLANADLILIGADTADTAEAERLAATIKRADKPVVGLGKGGYQLFGEMNLAIGAPHGGHGAERSVRPEAGSDFWDGYPVGPDEGTYRLYSKSRHVAIQLRDEKPADVVVLGREPGSDSHYPLVMQKPHYVLWGFAASPDTMTGSGEMLFPWTCYYTAALGRLSQPATSGAGSQTPAVRRLSRAIELQRKMAEAKGMPDARRSALVEQVITFLRTRPGDVTTSVESRLAFEVGRQIEQISDGETAAKVYRRMAEVFEQSADGRASQLARTLRGAARLAELPGTAMQLQGKTLTGERFDWSDYQGNVVLVQFWASWADQELQQTELARQLFAQYRDRGFEVVGVSLDSERENARSYAKQHQLPWVSLFQEGSGWSHPVAQRYGISKLPTMLVIGRDGKVVAIPSNGEQLAETVAALVEKKRDATSSLQQHDDKEPATTGREN